MIDEELLHYGTPRKSGRYEWGSGGTPSQRNKNFLSYVKDLKSKGVSEVEIAKGMGMNTSEFRAQKSIYKMEARKYDVAQVIKLKNKGLSNTAIGAQMGINESSVRSLLNPVLKEKNNITKSTADALKNRVAESQYIDIGPGSESYLGVTKSKMKTSVALLKEEGYKVHYVPIQQLGTNKTTTIKVLAAPDSEWSDLYKNKDKISLVKTYTENGGKNYFGIETPRNIDSKKISINYAEDGGTTKDGVIELRRNVPELSLGNSKYAQVRISVDGTHYLKGMAIYADDLPDGVNVRLCLFAVYPQ